MLAPGTETGGYRIERLVGRGGMGEVYEATQIALGRRVALKLLRTGYGHDLEFQERFRREGKLQAQLEHPNVVTVYEAGELTEGLFLAMRIVRGSTLKQLITAGELDVQRTLALLQPVADALDAAHDLALVHRDVKPQNILVGNADHPFLADFGLTRGSEDSGLTSTGQFIGTIDYISPEQVLGEPATSASDVYALAGVLYESLAGKVPYPRPSDAAVLYAHVNDEPPALTDLRSDLPSKINDLMARAMAKEPDARPQRASALLHEAADLLARDPSIAVSKPSLADALDRGVRPVEGETEDGHVQSDSDTALPPPVSAADSKTLAPKESDGSVPTRPLRRGYGRLALAVGVVFALGAGAFALGSAQGDQVSAQALVGSVSGDALTLRLPAGWRSVPRSETRPIDGVKLRDAVHVAKGDEAIVAGLSDATGPTLLPSALSRGAPQPDPVKLGVLEALRYRGLRDPGGGERSTAYAIPTTRGVLTIICSGAAGGGGDERIVCEQIARSVRLLEGRGYSLGPDEAALRAATQAGDGLRARRRKLRAQLAKARTGRGQTSIARALAASYEGAARRLRDIDVSPVDEGDVRAAEAALAGGVRAYRSLGSAARNQGKGAYRKASRQVHTADRAVDSRLRALASPVTDDG